jgi:IS30 family transposase
MAARKVTQDKLDELAMMDARGESSGAMAKHLGVSKPTVLKHLKRIQAERRENRLQLFDAHMEQLNELKRQHWRHVEQNGEINPAAGRLVLDILKEQNRMLGIGQTNINIESETIQPQVAIVTVDDRSELSKAMSLDVFQDKLIEVIDGD